MQYQSHANNEDHVSEIRDLCDANSTQYTIEAITRRFNLSLQELVGDIISADGVWQFDDTNYTDVPIGTINLDNGTQIYSFTDDLLQIEQIKIKDINGRWSILHPIDPKDFKTIAIEEYFPTTGLPTHYDIFGDSIKLYPAPSSSNVTLTAGLRVHFKRKGSAFTTTDTTKSPGIPVPYENILDYMVAIPYCAKYKPERVPLYKRKVDEIKPKLIEHYVFRLKDDLIIFNTSPIKFK